MTFAALNALFLAEDESLLALDRKMLRRFGVSQARCFSSGRDALDFLRAAAGPAIDMLVCGERLDDMTGLRFLSHVRSLPRISGMPVLLLVGNERSAAAAAGSGNFCAVLARPYSPDQAREALERAMRAESRQAPMALPPSSPGRFGAERDRRETVSPARRRNETPSPRNPGEIALREGLAALQRGDLIAADRLLHGSREADPGRVEPCLALSRLYAAMGKEAEETAWLCRAGVLCLKRGERTRAGTIFNRLPHGRSGQTPLLAEAGLELQAGEAKTAALAFLEAHRLDPSQSLHALIGRTCMFTPAPEEHMNGLIRALSDSGHGATAGKLHRRLLQPQKTAETERPAFFERFPLLCDIVSVASHTFKTWRHAA